MISRELLSEVIGEKKVILNYEVSLCGKEIHYGHENIDEDGFINIYELAHKNLKQWAKNKNVFDKIDWKEETEQIFKKAEELRDEINQ